MKTNEILHDEFLSIVETQLKSNNPPETKQTYERLISLGISDKDAKIYIAQCVASEIFHTIKHKRPYDEQRYIRNLNNLPDFPAE